MPYLVTLKKAKRDIHNLLGECSKAQTPPLDRVRHSFLQWFKRPNGTKCIIVSDSSSHGNRQSYCQSNQQTRHSTQKRTIYGQTEVTKDLIEARLAIGGVIKYECPVVAIEDFLDGKPRIIYEENGEKKS